MRFVLVDRFLAVKPGQSATASKTFDPSDLVVADHFPGFPVVPGVLLTEAMGQTAGWALAAKLQPERLPLLLMVESAGFRRSVRPGEEILLEAEITAVQRDTWTARTSASVGSERAVEARLVSHSFRRPRVWADFDAWTSRLLEEAGLGWLLEATERPVALQKAVL